jgi:hypothetical protein
MRSSKFYLGVLLIALCLGGCGKAAQKDMSGQIKQKLTELQQNINMAKLPTPTITQTGPLRVTEDWRSLFKLVKRELFKPFAASELSTENVFDATYHIKLKGVVVVVNAPKAIVDVGGVTLKVTVGQVFKDIEVIGIDTEGIDLKRSFKRVFIKVGEEREI